MKKAFCAFLALALVFAFAACSKEEEKPSGSPSPIPSAQQSQNESPASVKPSNVSPEAPDNTQVSTAPPEAPANNARIVMGTQEYIGENIAEIPYFEYDGDMNPELDSLNRLLNQGIGQTYLDFMDSADEDYWIEIRSYPFTGENFLQAVVTHVEYPNYGSDGDLFSVNYDKVHDRVIPVNEAFDELEISGDELKEMVESLYVPEVDSQYVGDIAVTGFLYRDGYIMLLLEITIENDEAEPWKYFFSFIPDFDELEQLDGSCLFDPNGPDQMNPPLSYQQVS